MSDIVRVRVAVIELSGCFSALSIHRVVCSALLLLLPFCGLLITLAAAAVVAVP